MIGLDVRYSVRQLWRRPVFTLTIVSTLATGLGAGAAIFTLIHSLETSPPAGLSRDDQLVRIRGVVEQQATGQRFGRSLTPQEFETYRAIAPFERAIAWTSDDVLFDVRRGEVGTVPARAIFVTRGYFDVLGVDLVRGRFAAGDDRGVVISHSLWQEQFGGGDVLGLVVHVDGLPGVITGVAPARFRGATVESGDNIVWMALENRDRPASGGESSSGSAILSAAARLPPGSDIASVDALISASSIRAIEASLIPEGYTAATEIAPLLSTNHLPSNGTEHSRYAALGGVALLILIAAGTNVSSLMLGAGVARRREIVVRLALGAGRARIVRQLLTESLLLAFAAGGAGLVILHVLLEIFRSRILAVDIALHWPSLAFTAAVAGCVGIIVGLSPALHATRLALAPALQDSVGGVATARLGAQRRLVILQVALTQPLLVAIGAVATLLGTGGPTELDSDRARRVIVARFNEHEVRQGSPGTELDALAREVGQIPGVLTVVPHAGGQLRSNMDVHPADRTSATPASFIANADFAAPGYFGLMGVRLVRGRTFQSSEDGDVVIIGNGLARQLWGGSDPIGRRLRRWRGGDTVEVSVVGVVDSEQVGASNRATGVRMFVPLHTSGAGGIRMIPQARSSYELLILTRTPSADIFRGLNEAALRAGDALTLGDAQTIASMEASADTRAARISSLAAAAALLTLLIACVGLYAVVALAVRERVREVGIRLAVGAQSGELVWQFVWIGLKLAAVGVAAGAPITALVLHQTAIATNLPTIAMAIVAAAGVMAATLFATWIPARRAAAVDPAVSLRNI